MVMHRDSQAFDHQRRDDVWTADIDGAGGLAAVNRTGQAAIDAVVQVAAG